MTLDADLRNRWLNNKFSLPLFNNGGAKTGDASLELTKIGLDGCVLKAGISEDESVVYSGYNCHHCLDQYRQNLGKIGLRVGCLGACENFYVARGMPAESLGLLGIMTTFGKPPIASLGFPVVETFEKYQQIEQLSLLSEQRNFRQRSMAADHLSRNL